jgi:hypothetical protein
MKEVPKLNDSKTANEPELHPTTADENPGYVINPEQASVNLKKKRKRIQR